MNTDNVNRIEVINHSNEGMKGRAYTYWSRYGNGIEKPKVEVELQDEGQTLKIFIKE